SLAVRLAEGASRTRITQHHAVGMIGDRQVTLSSQISVTSPTNVATARTSAFESVALVSSMLEGSLAQQQQDTYLPSSAVSYFSIYDSWNVQFLDVSAANLSAVLPTLTGTYGYDSTLLNAAAAAGYNFILPLINVQNNGNNSIALTGGAYFPSGWGELQYKSDAVAYLLNGRLKGGGFTPGADDPLKAALDSAKPQEEAPRLRDAVAVNTANGDFTVTALPDVVTGSGEFPFSLPFQRTYVSSNTYNEVVPAPWNFYGSYHASGWTDPHQGYYGSEDNSFARLGV